MTTAVFQDLLIPILSPVSLGQLTELREIFYLHFTGLL